MRFKNNKVFLETSEDVNMFVDIFYNNYPDCKKKFKDVASYKRYISSSNAPLVCEDTIEIQLFKKIKNKIRKNKLNVLHNLEK
jgi:hypothetical protein